MRGLRLAARLAQREVRRRPGRTALVTALVALPVAGMVMALVIVRTDDLTSDERWQQQNGDADAVLHHGTDERPRFESSIAALPPGSRTVVVEERWTRVRTADRRSSDLNIRGYDASDPLVDGLVDLVAGRAPTAGREIALTPRVADDLGVDVGDRLTLARPELTLAVVGLVEVPTYLIDPAALVAPGAELLAADGSSPLFLRGLVDLPAGTDLDEVRANHPSIVLRVDAGRDLVDAGAKVPWPYVIGSVVLTVVGIVIAAAFTAGARRQLVTLGQLSAVGAPGPVLRTVLVLQGTFTGLVGAAVGLVVAAGGLAAFRPTLETALGRRLGPYDVAFVDLAGAVVVGVAAATVAALVPASSVARVPTLTALAGRRPVAPVRHRVTLAGAAAAAIGLGLLGVAVLGSAATTGRHSEIWALVAIVGGVLELLGACAVAPAVVARLEPLAGRTRGSWRLAARSLARQRSRTGAIVSAVAAAVGLAVGATALVSSAEAGVESRPELSDKVVVVRDVRQYETTSPGVPALDASRPPDSTVIDDLAVLLPEARAVTVRMAGDQGDWAGLPLPVIADDAVLDAFELDAEVRQKLDEDGIVSLGVDLDSTAEVTLPDGSTQVVRTLASEHSMRPTGDVLITPERAEGLGLVPHEAALALRLDEPLTADQLRQLEDLRHDWLVEQTSGGGHIDLTLRWPDAGPTPVQVELVLTALALLFAVMVVGTSLALAAAESREEHDVLTVAGAAPGTLARAAGAKAWLLAGIGAAMALPVGLLPVAVFVAADDSMMQFVVPWRAIGLLAIALPVTVAVLSLAASAATHRLRPVTVSTAVFD